MALKRASKVIALPRRARHQRHARWQAPLARLEARLTDLELRLAGVERGTFLHTLQVRMRGALALSVLLHLVIILGIGVKMPPKPDPVEDKKSLEVVLVNAKSKSAPVKADFRAQHNLDGGGDTDEKRRAQTPLPAVREQKSDADVKLALRRVEQLEREARQLMTQAMPQQKPVETAPVQLKSAQTPEPEVKAQPSATDIMQRSFEIARLEGKIARDMEAHQQRPRRRFIGARAQEFRFARYIEDWRQKIQRVGDLNYPQAARDQQLHGSLLVTVAIRADGTVEQIEINRPSGHRELDAGARRIVELAGPFAAFPPDIAKDTDILHITRTWTFTPADRFVSEQ
ncbi:MAG: energy transducer TonB [Burkholderiales bacterium]